MSKARDVVKALTSLLGDLCHDSVYETILEKTGLCIKCLESARDGHCDCVHPVCGKEWDECECLHECDGTISACKKIGTTDHTSCFGSDDESDDEPPDESTADSKKRPRREHESDSSDDDGGDPKKPRAD